MARAVSRHPGQLQRSGAPHPVAPRACRQGNRAAAATAPAVLLPPGCRLRRCCG
jgi:hypothetical protein